MPININKIKIKNSKDLSYNNYNIIAGYINTTMINISGIIHTCTAKVIFNFLSKSLIIMLIKHRVVIAFLKQEIKYKVYDSL